MIQRLVTPIEKQSYFLFGPRGTGKTTWVKSRYPQAVYVDLLDAQIRNQLTIDPGRLKKYIPDSYCGWIILDEIQLVPDLLNEVHRQIFAGKNKFILTGSSARSLRRKGVNLLGGRALTRTFHPLTAVELGEKFDIIKALQYGHLPLAVLGKEPTAYLQSFVMNYLTNEVKQEGLTRNMGAFSRFLEVASFSQGNVLNYSEVAREAAIDRQVVAGYFDILDDLLVGIRLPVFTRKSKRKLIVHQKFFYFDAGVYRAIRPMGPLDAPESVSGAALETLVFQEVRAINEALNLGYGLYYWRTVNKVEVDFILYGPRGIIAIEVKCAPRIKSDMFSGLRAFGADYPMAKCFLVYGGERREYHKGVDIIGATDFLKTLPEILKAGTLPKVKLVNKPE